MTTLPPHLARFAEPTPVLDGGYVRLVDVYGDDLRIAQSARVSFAGDGVERLPERERDLVRYLFEHRHMSPFEQCVLTLEVRAPLFAVQQWLRHRTMRFNQESGRYTVLRTDFHVPTSWRTQSDDNKQGSGGTLGDWASLPAGARPVLANPSEVYDTPSAYLARRVAVLNEMARQVYEEAVSFGVAREQARVVLPVSTYTRFVVQLDLRNALHFLGLRTAGDAQAEMRAYADAVGAIVAEWCPWAHGAWVDFERDAVRLSVPEAAAVGDAVKRAGGMSVKNLTGRRGRAFAQKVQRMVSAAGEGTNL